MAEKELITKERVASRNENFLSGPKILSKPSVDFAVSLRKSKRQEAINEKRRKVCLGLSTSDQSSLNIQPLMETSITRENFQMFSECFKNPLDSFYLHNAIRVFRCFTQQRQELIFKLIMDLKIIPLIIRIIQNPMIQIMCIKEAIWSVSNMASGPSYIVSALVNEKVDVICKEFLSSNDMELFEYALWGLSNIAGDNIAYRNKINNMGVIEIILEKIDSLEFMMPTILWTIRNICEGGTILKKSTLVSLLGLLKKLIRFKKNEKITIEILWIFSYISDGNKSQIKKLIENKILEFIFQASSSQNSKYAIPAIRTLGNLACGSCDQCEILFSKGILETLYGQYEKSNIFYIKSLVLWTLANLTEGTRSQILIITKHPILIQVVTALNSSDSKCRNEAVNIIKIISKIGTHASIMALINVGFIKESKEFLMNSTDPKLVSSVIEITLSILKQLEDTHTSEIVALMNQNNYSSCLLQNIASKNTKVDNMVSEIFKHLDFEIENHEFLFG
ncbi:hypothetical protein SteCoe_16428 [Stentor coeruleus]|uniref:Importin subunit alpha n=1 Tax=Stentor coeruleus TaxID=5963 RepID=A0A1R2C1F1_9CILI|nr:hypothetical protein SteCoe_16428 [Stentor coeruleus]